ncbi:MAG: hypothetical protein KME17_24240 [Cyanosarcina radialis HA8281-LM2]|nr:hypothetical protein [Cyanosarcina radialis HA8281-LM2]
MVGVQCRIPTSNLTLLYQFIHDLGDSRPGCLTAGKMPAPQEFRSTI